VALAVGLTVGFVVAALIVGMLSVFFLLVVGVVVVITVLNVCD